MNTSRSAVDPLDDFLSHAVLRYDGDDGPGRWQRAREILTEHPELPEQSIFAAATVADPELITRHLAVDPEAADRPGGPMAWTPLMYLAYSRAGSDRPAVDAERSVMILLQHGADPNAGYLSQGEVPPFTVLTGLFGNGEQGSVNDPPHPHAIRLATLLLDAGADPNDGQSLYNRMFSPDDDHLELLLRYGLGTGVGGPWHRKFPERMESPAVMLRGQLIWAITHDMTSRIRLLAGHGVDLASPLEMRWHDAAPLTPVQLALQSGQTEVARLLVELGAPPATDIDSDLMAALLEADADRVADIEAREPGALARVRAAHPSLVMRAAVLDRVEAARLLVSLGFDVSARGRQDLPIEQEWETPLHLAAGDGNLELARALLDLGADPGVRDQRFDATPLGWAQFFGQSELIKLLEPVTPG